MNMQTKEACQKINASNFMDIYYMLFDSIDIFKQCYMSLTTMKKGEQKGLIPKTGFG